MVFDWNAVDCPLKAGVLLGASIPHKVLAGDDVVPVLLAVQIKDWGGL